MLAGIIKWDSEPVILLLSADGSVTLRQHLTCDPAASL